MIAQEHQPALLISTPDPHFPEEVLAAFVGQTIKANDLVSHTLLSADPGRRSPTR